MAMNFNMKEWGILGAVAGLIAAAISWVYGQFNIPSIAIKFASGADATIDVRNRLISGLDTSIGEKLVGFFNGYLPFEPGTWIMAAITGLVIVLAGRALFSIDFVRSIYTPRTAYGKIAMVMLLGTVVLALLMKTMVAGLTIEFGSLLLTLLIYFLIVSYLLTYLYKTMGRSVPN